MTMVIGPWSILESSWLPGVFHAVHVSNSQFKAKALEYFRQGVEGVG